MTDPLKTPQAEALLKDSAALRQLIDSPEGRRLAELMARQGDLPRAAQQARQGDPSQLTRQLAAILQTPEGAKLAEAIRRNLPKS